MTTKQRIKDLAPEVSEEVKAKVEVFLHSEAVDCIFKIITLLLTEQKQVVLSEIRVSLQKTILHFDPNLIGKIGMFVDEDALRDYIKKSKDIKYCLTILDLILDRVNFLDNDGSENYYIPGLFIPRKSFDIEFDYCYPDVISWLKIIAINIEDSYDLVYKGSNRGVFLKNNVEIIEAVKKTGDQELIDIIKSANRVGVADLKPQLNKLSTKLDIWGKECLNNDKDKKHPITKLISNFREALNDCPLSGGSESVQHGISNPKEKYTINLRSQRVLFDMGLTLVRLKLEFQNFEDVIKNEQ